MGIKTIPNRASSSTSRTTIKKAVKPIVIKINAIKKIAYFIT
jgi:hypothetical protein|tara:strand:+ start:91 stop:216 length:126 start_codon:yes stop_codon:yes gene_type:complete